ncbi:hypothetical protein [Bradyrhizobium sp. LTSP885]|nr:hypothetical protein [Bradyrhizobium sp. LTSP885]
MTDREDQDDRKEALIDVAGNGEETDHVGSEGASLEMPGGRSR